VSPTLWKMYISSSLAHVHLSQDIHVWHMCLPHEILFGTQISLVPHGLFDSHVCHIKHALAHTLFATRLSHETVALAHASLMKHCLWHVCPCFMAHVSWIIFSLLYVLSWNTFLNLCVSCETYSL